MNAFGDCAQTSRAMINRVHRGDDGEKNLGRADVAGRFVPANVLLARLQGKAICGSTFSIVRNANKSSGHVTLVLIARCKVAGVRSAETKRNSETLSVSNRDVRPKFAGRF